MFRLFILAFILSPILSAATEPDAIHIRINQMGYLPKEPKIALLFSNNTIAEKILLVNTVENRVIARFRPKKSNKKGWGTFKFYYELDFSAISEEGEYRLQTKNASSASPKFKISSVTYNYESEQLLGFMRQQRCGYNPFFDIVCHQLDGRSFYGPMPDSTFVDTAGGWHDAGDQLKYLITGSYATAHMLKAYELFPETFVDSCNHLGQPISNDIADVLDEAKWGLDWILKLQSHPGQLIHQIADDRDHRGWKMPDNDHSDYGWGPNGYRAAYFATGSPQGLNKYKSEATGIANLAGRSAAAMAIAARIWKKDLQDSIFAAICLKAAKSLYKLGKEKEGYQQGNSYGAPNRYNDKTWADDMEWGAAELYKTTKNKAYLEDAKKYAIMANTVSWMPYDSVPH